MIITSYKVTNADYKSICTWGSYAIDYTIGTTVRMIPNTLGIMAFDNLMYAIYFHRTTQELTLAKVRLLQLEVDVAHKLYVDPRVCGDTSPYALSRWYTAINPFGGRSVRGTVCYSQVKVVRELHKSEGVWA